MAYNYGAFFGDGSSDSSNNIFNSINLSEYSAVKNGSYGKLVKSYYAKETSSSTKSEESSDKKTKNDDTYDTTGLSKMKKETDALASSVENLSDEELWKMKDGEYDMDKIASAIKSYVTEYNDTISQSANVTNTEVTKQTDNMSSMTGVMSKTLAKVGITVGADGKLSLDEDTLKGANIKDIKSLFEGKNSYASQIAKYATDASKSAVNASVTYSADGSLTSALMSNFTSWT